MVKKQSVAAIHYFDCGSCKNFMPFVYRGHRPQIRRFPSGVFLLEHTNGRKVLFDTGYSQVLYKTGLKGRLYRILNPTVIEAGDEIAAQLNAAGIDPASIDYIVLSHLHPDHIGGIASFPESTFIISEPMHKTLLNTRFTDLLFKQFVPDWFLKKTTILADSDFRTTRLLPFKTHDLFGDTTILICQLPGHTPGHLGLFINSKILLAGDASWGADLLSQAKRLTAIAQSIQHSFSEYTKTNVILRQLQDDGITVYCSHDQITKKELL